MAKYSLATLSLCENLASEALLNKLGRVDTRRELINRCHQIEILRCKIEAAIDEYIEDISQDELPF